MNKTKQRIEDDRFVRGGGSYTDDITLPILQNAIADALAPFDVRDVPMPATAESLWRLMDGG